MSAATVAEPAAAPARRAAADPAYCHVTLLAPDVPMPAGPLPTMCGRVLDEAPCCLPPAPECGRPPCPVCAEHHVGPIRPHPHVTDQPGGC